jgi:hypothetical protein
MTRLRDVVPLISVLALAAAPACVARAAEKYPDPQLLIPIPPEIDPELSVMLQIAPPPSGQALLQIPDPGRRLLAFRSYMRAGASLADRWSWTRSEIEAFQGSDEQVALLAAVKAVGDHFAEANPGYEIYANTKVRSLDLQIERWNANRSVGIAADDILWAWRSKFGDNEKAAADPKKLAAFARGFSLRKRANLAAPGLTAHGQARAIDFQIKKDGTIIADTNSRKIETAWRAEGWDVKLKESMDAAGPAFSGPLTAPDEPWHYSYDPSIAVVVAEDGENED